MAKSNLQILAELKESFEVASQEREKLNLPDTETDTYIISFKTRHAGKPTCKVNVTIVDGYEGETLDGKEEFITLRFTQMRVLSPLETEAETEKPPNPSSASQGPTS